METNLNIFEEKTNPFVRAFEYIDAFIDHLNIIYWEGYAQQLKETNPAEFNTQFVEFINLFV